MRHAVAIVVVFAFMTAIATADWQDNFDSYVEGSNMHGQGGWVGWDNDPLAGAAKVSAAFSHTSPHSVKLTTPNDLVHEYDGYTAGRWDYITWQYVPSTLLGDTYFILLNTYNHGGPYNWSTQIRFNAVTGTVESQFEAATLDLIPDQWVELRVEIDLDTDTQEIYYGGQLLSAKSWSGGVSGGGLVDIGAVDLYPDRDLNTTECYYDTMSLAPPGGGFGLGDMDCDGDVDAFDIDAFVLALTNPAAYNAMYPNCNIMNGDMDCNGLVDAFDIDLFVICLTTGVCECP